MATLPERATHQRTRAFNQQLVLRAIYDRDAVSRAELARLTGWNVADVRKKMGTDVPVRAEAWWERLWKR